MYRSKLRTMAAIVATVAGFSAFAASAQAQISGSIGGDVVANDPAPVLHGSAFTNPLAPVTVGRYLPA